MIILGIDPGLAIVGIGIIDASIRPAAAGLLSMTPYKAID